MGHGRKNTNRGEAIARNTTRVREFGKKVRIFEQELRLHRKMIVGNKTDNQAEHEALERRLALLERPIHRKALDWIRATWRRIRDRIRPPAPTGLEPTEVIVDEAAAMEEEKTDPGIEIVNEHRKSLLDIVEENKEGTDDGKTENHEIKN